MMKLAFTCRTSTALSIVTACVFVATPHGMCQTLPDTIDRVRPSIVRVITSCAYETETKPRRTSGTGFLVSDEGFALTAAHVVQPCAASVRGTGSNEQLRLIRQQFSIGLSLVHSVTDQTHTRGNFSEVAAELAELDSMHDVALLRMLQNPFRTKLKSGYTLNGAELELERSGIAITTSRKLRDGEPIAISGYPDPLGLDKPIFDTNAGIVASIHSSRDFDVPTYFNSGMAQVHVRVTFDLYEADLIVNPGNSGGPVYDVSSGEVVGICSAFRLAPVKEILGGRSRDSVYAYNSGLAVIVPIAYGTALMQKHGISVPQASR